MAERTRLSVDVPDSIARYLDENKENIAPTIVLADVFCFSGRAASSPQSWPASSPQSWVLTDPGIVECPPLAYSQGQQPFRPSRYVTKIWIPNSSKSRQGLNLAKTLESCPTVRERVSVVRGNDVCRLSAEIFVFGDDLYCVGVVVRTIQNAIAHVFSKQVDDARMDTAVARILLLFQEAARGTIMLNALKDEYKARFGHELAPSLYGARYLKDFLMLPHLESYISIVDDEDDKRAVLENAIIPADTQRSEDVHRYMYMVAMSDLVCTRLRATCREVLGLGVHVEIDHDLVQVLFVLESVLQLDSALRVVKEKCDGIDKGSIGNFGAWIDTQLRRFLKQYKGVPLIPDKKCDCVYVDTKFSGKPIARPPPKCYFLF